MLNKLVFFLVAALLLPISTTQAAPDNSREVAEAISRAFGRAAKGIMPSVVNIVVSGPEHPASSSSGSGPAAKKGKKGAASSSSTSSSSSSSGEAQNSSSGLGDLDERDAYGSGTGVIVDEDGFILTNNHVIQDAERVTVKLFDKRSFSGKVIGQEIKSDLALIKISADDLDPAPLGDSDKLIVGQWVIAAGNPFGLTNSITSGIISAYGRALISGAPEMEFIQTDAAINPGNSGGPLINLEGEVIGINTAIFSRSGGYMGIGFAIPINRAKAVVQPLIDKYKAENP
jgi:S1-C subfamily serine protease